MAASFRAVNQLIEAMRNGSTGHQTRVYQLISLLLPGKGLLVLENLTKISNETHYSYLIM